MTINTNVTAQPAPTDIATRARDIARRLPGQARRQRLDTARLEYGPLYTLAEIHQRVAQTLPQKIGFIRRAVFQPIESYQGLIPDEALIKYDDAARSGLFSAFTVVTPTYFSKKQVDPWIVAQVDGAELDAAQRPRFRSTKAWMRARASGLVLSAAPYASGSAPRPGRRSSATIALVASSPPRGERATSAAQAAAAASSVGAATTRFTRPRRSASLAWTMRPVSSKSRAWAPPTTSRSRAIPYAGLKPSVTSGSPKRARSDAMRRSWATASIKPPPSAWPSMAASVTCGSVAKRAINAAWRR